MTAENGLGLIHVYTGEGKGKTTAAIGLALRAAMSGYRVWVVQFMKGESEESAEITGIKKFSNVTVSRVGGNLLGKEHPPVDKIRKEIDGGLKEVEALVAIHMCDVLILDEINVALSLGLADIYEVLKIAQLCKGEIELIMTGRNAPQEIIDIADYVSDCKPIKHPLIRGVLARRGIEF